MIEIYFLAFVILSITSVAKRGLSYELMYIYSGATIYFAISFVEGINQTFLEGIALSITLTMAGLVLANSLLLGNISKRALPASFHTAEDLRIFHWSATITLAISILHFSIAGLPILSDDIEVDRFTSATSGFGGIPSRVATYGPALILLYISVLWKNRTISKSKALILSVCFSLLIIVQGHKSSVLQLLLLGLVAGVYVRFAFSTVVKLAAVGLFSVVFGNIIFERMGVGDQFDYLSYIQERLSYIMLEPGYELFNRSDTGGLSVSFGSPILNDLIYPIGKLLGIDIETLNTQLSRYIYRVDEGNFTVPVTPGFYAYHVYALNDFAAHFLSFAFGVCCVVVQRAAIVAKSSNRAAILYFMQYWLYVGYSSGNLYYLLPNLLFSLIIIVAPPRAWAFFTRRT